jgi:hypothetical protein
LRLLEKKKQNLFVIPTVIEALILIGIALISDLIEITYPNIIICLLLLLWNAKFVCDTNFKRSCENNASNRTFTDLGIDISAVVFWKYIFSKRN